ncbi:MAG: glycosyltransferase family 25 protein [bacterium]
MKFKTFVINMKKSPERLIFMSNQLNKLDMDFTIQEGVDGNTYDFKNDYNEELSKKFNGGKTVTKGEIGCALSHRRILETMLKENFDYVLILEDDVELSPNFKKILDQELTKRDAGITKWEYISFNYPSVGWKSIALWLFLFFHMMKENKKNITYWLKLPIYFIKFIGFSILCMFEGLREILYKKIYTYGTTAHFYRPLYLAGCYLVNKDGAKKLLELNAKLSHTADGLPNEARIKKGLKFYAFVPLVAKQKREIFPSTLNNKHFSKKVITY